MFRTLGGFGWFCATLEEDLVGKIGLKGASGEAHVSGLEGVHVFLFGAGATFGEIWNESSNDTLQNLFLGEKVVHFSVFRVR